MADPTRLRLLNLLRNGEVCVCYFVQILGQTQPKVSRHLAYLRRAGLAAARRDGKWMHYRLTRPDDKAVAGVLDAAMLALRGNAAMQADMAMLERACCGLIPTIQAMGAPRPARPQGAKRRAARN